ncbi:glycoside hydrolase family 16 protein [Oharaeibacter diazotrophicus]|uniref:Glycosyl hydrolase family 16 n=1 Tax=Oharaeibacter diazotrophicus TaxID=1920512 RepID=A0A4R6RIN6_9HYPH|nr:glycoside hydrolase family 16 protein [Oharaeibacter diazotrophicus]TDP86343.1 glycosyl hydrolase family 16 [Oharaeibacter diazotrophicus]BBE71714.1 glycosyl hydrolases family 16 [Pleomorphomonas sp. SM30]GLS78480.1 hypothetical protein GCM10007904_38170 [Oharaeibacter diazotrophicus]
MPLWPPVPRTEPGRTGRGLVFSDDFDAPGLNRARWSDLYLPHWTGDGLGRARFGIAGGALTLEVPDDLPPWCPEHDGDIRVSALQTGHRAGPVGSPDGQHRFRPELRVRRRLPELGLYLPLRHRIEMRARAVLDAGALASLYLIGFEEHPDDSGEITLMEVFGRKAGPDGTVVRRGIKAIGDPRMATEILDDRLPLRIEDWHVYAADWTAAGVAFEIDGRPVGRVAGAPDYPMQLMLTLYRLAPAETAAPPARFEVDYVRGYA